MIKAGCLFSGMGGFCTAFHNVGIDVIWANDNDEFACKTFRHNFEYVTLFEKDIKVLNIAKDSLEPVNLLAAGFPCQSFSQAGNRKGFDDPRGALFFEIVRILKEFDDQRPAILLLENVPNLMYGNKGRWIYTVINEIQRAGYWFKLSSCKMLNTSEVSHIPQIRERLFMVAFATNKFPMNSFDFPEAVEQLMPLNAFIDRSKPASDDHYLPKDNRYYAMIENEIEQGGNDAIYQLRKYIVRVYKNVCPTLTANMGTGGHNVPFINDSWGIRKLTVEECLKLQGFNNNFFFPDTISNQRRYMQIGNTVSVPVVEKLATRCADHLKKIGT